MFKIIKTAAFSALIGLTALSAASVAAQADSLYLGFGSGNEQPRVGVYLGDDGPRHRDRDGDRFEGRRGDRDRFEGRDRDRYDGRRGDREDRQFRRQVERGCSPERALNKAERMGIRRARIDYVGRNAIGVTGRSRGDRISITFARAPNCPIIG